MSNIKIIFNNNEELVVTDTTYLVGLRRSNELKNPEWVESVQFVGIEGSFNRNLSQTREFAEFCLNCEFFYVVEDRSVHETDILNDTLYSVNSIYKILRLN